MTTAVSSYAAIIPKGYFMIKLFKYVVIALCLITLTACQSEQNREIVELETPDGHAMTFMPITEKGVTDVTVRLAWATDWSMDPDMNQTVPYLSREAIANSGTADMSLREIIELFEDKNSYAMVAVGAEHVSFEFEFPNNYQNDVFPVVLDFLTNNQPEQRWLDRLRTNLKTTQAAHNAHVSATTFQMAARAVLGDTPLFQALFLENLEAFDDVTLGDIADWKQTHIHNKPVSIVVTGATSSKKAMDIVDRLLAELPDPIDQVQPIDTVFEIPAGKIYVNLPEAEKTFMAMIGNVPATDYTDAFQDLIALKVLGGGVESPINLAVRQELGASYGMFVELFRYNMRTRGLTLGGEVEGAKLADAFNSLSLAYDDFVTQPELPAFDETRNLVADEWHQKTFSVNGSARMIETNNIDPITPFPGLDVWDYVQDQTKFLVMERVKTAFPNSTDMLWIAAGPKPSDWPDACVVQSLDDVDACLQQ